MNFKAWSLLVGVQNVLLLSISLQRKIKMYLIILSECTCSYYASVNHSDEYQYYGHVICDVM